MIWPEMKNKLITIALARSDGNIAKAARMLGVSGNGLRYMIKQRQADSAKKDDEGGG